jgi:hypothetical protein
MLIVFAVVCGLANVLLLVWIWRALVRHLARAVAREMRNMDGPPLAPPP